MQAVHELDIDDELREEMERALLAQIKSAMAGVTDRDANFAAYADAVEGLSDTTSPSHWPGSCNLSYPLTYDAVKTTLDNLTANFKREPLVTVDPVHSEDEDEAEGEERYLEAKAQEFDVRERLGEVADYACTFGTGIMYAGWKSSESKLRSFRSLDPQTGEEVYEEDEQDEVEYVQSPQEEYVHEQGLDLRAVHPADFFLYPADARCLSGQGAARGCGERLMLTADELLTGIDDFGYDEDAVYDLLSRGGFGAGSGLRRQGDSQVGVEAEDAKDGFFECVVWFSKPPLVWRNGDDGENEMWTPREILHDDLMLVCCPERDIVLRMDFSPYAERCYIPFYINKPAGKFYGRSIPQILEGLQKEADAEFQSFVDSVNLIANPAFKQKQSSANLNPNFQFFPGAKWLFQSDPNEIMPFDMPPIRQEPLSIVNLLDGKAKQITSGDSNGALHNKVRKAAEIQAVEQAKFQKFSATADAFSPSVVKLFQVIAALCASHMEDEGEDFVDSFDHKGKITKASLKKKFLYRGTMSDPGATPEDRLQICELAAGIAEKYLQAEMGLAAAPDKLKRVWHGSRQTLVAAGVHNPQAYIGPEPQIPEGFQPGQQGIANGQQPGQQQAQLAGVPNQPAMAGLPAPPPAG